MLGGGAASADLAGLKGAEGEPSVTSPEDAGWLKKLGGLALNFSTQPAQQK
jgi:hypothetical protein